MIPCTWSTWRIDAEFVSITLNPNSYRVLKLLEHAVKLYEKILDGRLYEMVDTDKMQCGFMPGRGTVYTVFVLRRLWKIQSQK